MHARDLEGQSRSELIARAELLGVEKALLLTRAELVDEIVRRTVADPIERRLARGLLGLARDLVASVVERGLHLPDAAAKIRAIPVQTHPSSSKPPIATVTLAEIYAAQGHRKRALRVLDEVLVKEPDHTAARHLHDAIAASGPDEPVMPPEPDEGSVPAPRMEVPPEPAPAIKAAIESAPESGPLELAPEESTTDAAAKSTTAAAPLESATVESARTALTEPAPAEEFAEDAVALSTEPAPYETYDADEIVLLPVDAATVFVYWETRDATLSRMRKETPAGTLVMRIVAVTPSWHGPIIETRDLETDLRVGEWFVRDLPYGAILRAALGWRSGEHFEPLSVAMRVSELPAVLGQQSFDDSNAPAPEDDAVGPASERARERVSRAAASQGSASWVALPSVPAPPFDLLRQDLVSAGAH